MAKQTQVLTPEEMSKKLAEEAMTVEAKALLQCMGKLLLGLSASVESIASKCFAKELIADDLYSGMFDGEWRPEYLRAYYFTDRVYNKLKQFERSNPANPEKVETTISTLAKIIRRDSALEHIAKILGNYINSTQSIPLHTLYILMYILILILHMH